MSRKDYEMIASAIRKMRAIYEEAAFQDAFTELAGLIAEGFQSDNPRFDRDRFLSATF